MKQKMSSNTSKLNTFWGAQIEDSQYEKILKDGHLKTLVISPLLLGESNTGLAVFGLNKAYTDLSDHEIESLSNFNNIIAVAIDRAVLYDKLTHTNAALEKANSSQQSLMRFINHQVKGFFTRSRIIFDSLKTDYKDGLSKEVQHLVDVGFETNTEAVEMVRALLDASNLKDGTMHYQKVTLNIRALIADVIKPLKELAETKGINLNTNLGSGDVMVDADITQLTQVIRNLVENSINYTHKGSVEVGLEENKKTKQAIFEVVDSGIGLTDEDMEKLFTEGGRGQRAKEQNVNSTGYGLFIAKQIVDQHDGEITASSAGEGKGSKFTVKLPLAK
jgi:signal transduction histidine kinase